MSYRPSPLQAAAACLVCFALAAPVIRAAEETKPPAETAKPQATAPKHNLPPAEERAHRLTERMKEKLNLSEDQVPKVEEINLRTAKQTDTAVQASTREDRQAKMRAAQEQRDKDLKDVLNQDQWKKYQQIKGELKSEAHAKTQAHAHAPKSHT